MEKQGYDKKLSIAVILGGASLDPLIPPSVLAVLVGSLANVSIAKLLFSGFGPGFLLSASLIIYVLVSVKLNPKLAPISQISSSIREKLWSLCSMLPFGAIIFLILGLMMLGIATPTESAATGVVGALVLVASLRRLTFQVIKTSIWGTIRISAMVLLIIAGCKAFAQILAVSGATQGLVAMVVKFQLPNLILLIIMQVIALILGCFLDQVAIMLITIPVYLPVIETVGFDPLWFWCLYLINMTVGGITPPFGLVLYVLKGATPSTPLEEIFRAATPVVLMFLAGMALVIMFPEIAVWIPNWAIR
jgi:tripartite ATP-independent transporter DctM subunit